MESLKKSALAYAAKGWPVFPVGRNKAPLVDGGFHAATTNPEQIESWWSAWPEANIGFSPGHAGLMVIDLDPGHDPAFAQSLPATGMAQSTPRGGQHLFYALGAGETCKSPQSRVAEHVDVRSAGAYVLLHPSATADGAYAWTGEGKPAYRPDELLRVANSAREKNPERDVWPIAPDLPENIQRAIDWLQDTAAPAIEGRGGDAKTVAAAAMLRSLGISEGKALDLMLDHYNPRCNPHWDDDAMALKVRNGYLFANGQPGELTQAFREAQVRSLFSPVELVVSPDLTQVGRFRAVDRDGMDLIKEPAWLIEDCIPEGGYAVLFGPPGGLKTFVALDMALSIATGTTFPWDGLWPRVNGGRPVLFAAGEGRANIVKRLAAWEKKHWGGRRVKNFIMVDPVPRVAEPEAFKDFLKLGDNMSPDGYALVVIDTVGRAMSGINENAQEHASKFTLMISAMQQHFGSAILALHHTGHGNGDRAKGSIVFEADADTMIRVDREEDSEIFRLVMTKQKDAAEWRSPRIGQAYEIMLPGGRKSLAVGEPSEETLEALKPVEGAGQDKSNVLEIVETATEKVLKSVTGRVWSQKALAEAVAMDPNIDIPSNKLASHWLVMLREKTGSKAASWYEPATSRWRMK